MRGAYVKPRKGIHGIKPTTTSFIFELIFSFFINYLNTRNI